MRKTIKLPSMKFRIFVLYFFFIINLSITSIYILLDILGFDYLKNWDFTLLLIYDLVTFIMLGELIKQKNEN